MVRAGCVFVAGIHPSRTSVSGSFESVRWNACVHRLDLGLYSHPKEFFFFFLGGGGGGGMEFEPMLSPREKSPLPENFPRGGSNPRRCGQRAQTLPTSYSGPQLLLESGYKFSVPLDANVSVEMVVTRKSNRGDTVVPSWPNFCLREATSSGFLWTLMCR